MKKRTCPFFKRQLFPRQVKAVGSWSPIGSQRPGYLADFLSQSLNVPSLTAEVPLLKPEEWMEAEEQSGAKETVQWVRRFPCMPTQVQSPASHMISQFPPGVITEQSRE